MEYFWVYMTHETRGDIDGIVSEAEMEGYALQGYELKSKMSAVSANAAPEEVAAG